MRLRGDGEVLGERYRQFLAFFLGRATVATVVVREQLEFSANAQDVLDRLAPALVSRERVQEWPGTRLVGQHAELVMFDFNDATCAVLASAVDGLFHWQQPLRPEDLALGRESVPMLWTVAHEGIAIVDLDHRDASEFIAQFSDLVDS